MTEYFRSIQGVSLSVAKPAGLMQYCWMMDAIETLRRTVLFRDIREASLERLSEGSRTIEIPRGDHLFHEGDEGSEMFVLSGGGIRLYKLAADGQETTVKIVGPFEAFAEVVFFDEGPYPVSAVAVKNSTAHAFSKKTFQTLLDDGAFRREFISMLVGKMRYLSNRIHYLTAYDVEERFFLFLLDQCGPVEKCRVDMPKKEIAAAIGTIPETLSRLILRLRERGDIEWKGSTIRLRKGFWDDMKRLATDGPARSLP